MPTNLEDISILIFTLEQNQQQTKNQQQHKNKASINSNNLFIQIFMELFCSKFYNPWYGNLIGTYTIYSIYRSYHHVSIIQTRYLMILTTVLYNIQMYKYSNISSTQKRVTKTTPAILLVHTHARTHARTHAHTHTHTHTHTMGRSLKMRAV